MLKALGYSLNREKDLGWLVSLTAVKVLATYVCAGNRMAKAVCLGVEKIGGHESSPGLARAIHHSPILTSLLGITLARCIRCFSHCRFIFSGRQSWSSDFSEVQVSKFQIGESACLSTTPQGPLIPLWQKHGISGGSTVQVCWSVRVANEILLCYLSDASNS